MSLARLVPVLLAGAFSLVRSAVSQVPTPPAAPDAEGIEITGEEVIVPMASQGGHPVVEVMLDGRGPFRMVLDTGSSRSVVSEGLVEKLQLPLVGEARVQSPLGPAPSVGKLARIARLDLGGVSITGMTVAVADLSRIFRGRGDPVGLLSADLFSGLLVTLDASRRRAVLRPGELPPADGANIFPYDRAQTLPTIRIAVAGIRVDAHVDTGSSRGLVLPAALAKSLPLTGPLLDAGKARTVGASVPLREARLDGSVKIGRLVLKDPVIVFAEGAPAGNIGFEILRHFTLTLDHSNRRLRIE